jgi:hypothetical protein
VVKREGSTLFLRVFAKTAYFSANKTRMENPEPVDVDISKFLSILHWIVKLI